MSRVEAVDVAWDWQAFASLQHETYDSSMTAR
jgi:hypothetical protein